MTTLRYEAFFWGNSLEFISIYFIFLIQHFLANDRHPFD